MAELLPAVRARFSCRAFTAQPVAEAELNCILEAGRLAPSAFGMEPWRFIVARSAESRRALATACFDQTQVSAAPVLIAIVALAGAVHPGSAYVRERLLAESGGVRIPDELMAMYAGFCAQLDLRGWAIAQCNFAAMQMMIQASALGLATCPIGGFDEAALAKALELSAGEAPALVLALGHCAQAQGERRRRVLGEIVHFV